MSAIGVTGALLATIVVPATVATASSPGAGSASAALDRPVATTTSDVSSDAADGTSRGGYRAQIPNSSHTRTTVRIASIPACESHPGGFVESTVGQGGERYFAGVSVTSECTEDGQVNTGAVVGLADVVEVEHPLSAGDVVLVEVRSTSSATKVILQNRPAGWREVHLFDPYAFTRYDIGTMAVQPAGFPFDELPPLDFMRNTVDGERLWDVPHSRYYECTDVSQLRKRWSFEVTYRC